MSKQFEPWGGPSSVYKLKGQNSEGSWIADSPEREA